MVRVIVANYRTDEYLDAFIASFRKFYPDLYGSDKLTVVDINPEQPRSADYHYIPIDFNCGYAYAVNLAASETGEEYMGFFNADTEFLNRDCIPSCVDLLEENPDIGVVGPFQYTHQGQVTAAGIFGSNRKRLDRGWKQTVSDEFRDVADAITVSGSAYFTKRSLWSEMMSCRIFRREFPDALGAFLPTPLYYEETGYSYHVRSHGYRVVYNGEAEMIHDHAKSPGTLHDKAAKAHESKKIFNRFCWNHGIDH